MSNNLLESLEVMGNFIFEKSKSDEIPEVVISIKGDAYEEVLKELDNEFAKIAAENKYKLVKNKGNRSFKSTGKLLTYGTLFVFKKKE